VLLLGLFWGPPSAWPWGFTGHRKITAAAIDRLPEPLQGFMLANARGLAEHSVDPDLWVAAGDSAEGPNHYFDVDALAAFPFTDVPREEREFLERFGEAGKNAGRLPWSIAEAARDLAEAFRAGDGGRIRRLAAVVAHYVEDLHVPLHLTGNHDGQETGQLGIHSRWESELVQRFFEQIPWPGAGSRLRAAGEPVEFVFERIRQTYPSVAEVLASDRKAVAGAVDFFETPQDDRYGAAYFSRLFTLERERLSRAASSAAEAVARLWLEAWEQAGRPPLPRGFRDRFVRGETRAILMSWDGAAEALVERLLGEGKLPNLARLAAGGTSFDFAFSTFPTKTAPAHAAMYTGATGEASGISGNEVLRDPSGQYTALDRISGYSALALRAEPLWVTAARQGLRAVSLHSTQSHPFDPFLAQKRFGADFGRNLLLFHGYSGLELDDEVLRGSGRELAPARGWKDLPPVDDQPWEFHFEVWGTSFHAVLLALQSDSRPGYDRLILATDKRDPTTWVHLAPLPAGDPQALQTRPFVLQREGSGGSVFFRLFELAPDGRDFLLYRSKIYSEHLSRPGLAMSYLEEVGGFLGNDPSRLYEEGGFGPPLMEGGDGTAEARYLETVRLMYRQFERAADFVLTRTDWDVFFHYIPFPDDTQHLWYGLTDPALPSHDPRLGARFLPLLEEVYRLNDHLLGVILDRAPANTIFALTSDHGVSGIDRVVYPNLALKKAGLLATDGSGAIDVRRTQVFYHPANASYLLLNRQAYRAGLVAPEDEGMVLDAAQRALESVRDPETGRPVFTSFFNALQDGGKFGIGGAWGGDLYLDVAYGYEPRADVTGEQEVVAVKPIGYHGGLPTRAEMHAILYMAGPGVKKGQKVGSARLIDIASTLAYLLGIEPPRQSRGRVLDEAIEPAPEW
jgi:predicted AlkP superfamily pyrophosphatase or phosphodiesterase